MGSAALRRCRQDTGRLNVGDELVVAGNIALFGTERLIEENQEKLKDRFSAGFLNQSLRTCRESRAVKAGETPQTSRAWKMAEAAGANAFRHGRQLRRPGKWRRPRRQG